MQLFQQSEATAAQRRLFFQAVDATDGITAETGLTGTGWLSKNGAAPVATTASITEISATNMPGRYYIEFTAAEVNTLAIIEFRFKAAACAEVVKEAQVVPWDPYDVAALGLSRLDAAVSSRSSHSAAAAGTDAAGKVLATPANLIATEADGMVHADLKEWLGVAMNALVSGRVDGSVGAMAAAVLTAAAIAANAIDANAFAQAAADKVFGSGGATLAELPQGIPPANPRPDQLLMLFYMALRDKTTVTKTSPEASIFNDAGVKIAKQVLSDDGETFTRDEMISGA